ncbi:uncharacterized protein DS421_2g41530 [Arachis hypogaea]|nr:uncharacterized protein DS421_2g41530 [Arachis hypogaea]
MNPFLSPPPSATEPFQSFTQRRRTFRPSTSSQTAPANTIVAEPAPPASPPTASFLASRRQHHPATHSIVSGLAETRIAAAIESSQIRSLQFSLLLRIWYCWIAGYKFLGSGHDQEFNTAAPSLPPHH